MSSTEPVHARKQPFSQHVRDHHRFRRTHESFGRTGRRLIVLSFISRLSLFLTYRMGDVAETHLKRQAILPRVKS